jgi:hypothetical protein
MKPNDYTVNPALRPTILVNEVLNKVYRPSREIPQIRPEATPRVARETDRAA